MSSLEWRRDQPRIEPPADRIRNPLFTTMLLFDSFVWTATFVVHGETQGLLWALAFGFLAAKVP